jgi:glycosyltransferase involved in cell wall biosynthesis
VPNAPNASMAHQKSAIGILLNDFQLGGCERVAIRLANAWSGLGLRVVLYVADDVGSLRPEVSPGVEVRFADPPIPASPLQSLRLGWWAGRRMRADGVTRCFLPGNSQFDGALPVRLATRSRVPVYAKISNPLWRPDRSLLGNAAFRLLTRLRLSGVAGLAALSPRLLRHDGEAIGLTNRIHVLPDAMGSRWPHTDGTHRRPLHLCAVGRLVPQKNFSLALRSVALLQDLPVTLTLVGDGAQRQELQSLARSLGIADRVRFVGAVADCSGFMAEAEAMISTSRYEGYPAVMIEALVAGTFVIASRSSCAIDDILPSALLGSVVEDARPAAFAAAIRAFFASPQRSAHAARRELARNLFASHLDQVSAREYLAFMRVGDRQHAYPPAHTPFRAA